MIAKKKNNTALQQQQAKIKNHKEKKNKNFCIFCLLFTYLRKKN